MWDHSESSTLYLQKKKKSSNSVEISRQSYRETRIKKKNYTRIETILLFSRSVKNTELWNKLRLKKKKKKIELNNLHYIVKNNIYFSQFKFIRQIIISWLIFGVGSRLYKEFIFCGLGMYCSTLAKKPVSHLFDNHVNRQKNPIRQMLENIKISIDTATSNECNTGLTCISSRKTLYGAAV